MTPLRGLANRDPFLVFLAVAAAIFALYWAVTARRETIDVPLSVQKSLSDDYEMMAGRKPDAQAKAKLIHDYVADELLFREAVERGMHMTDKTTKQRLIDRVRFMIAGAPADPSEDQLMGYYATHRELYRAEPRLSVDHVFFEQRPGNESALLATLRSGGTVKGDDFWMGHDLPDYGESMLRGMFGQSFLDVLRKTPTGQWVGPLKSTRGWHFARVRNRGASAMLPYTDVRDQVKQDYLAAETGALVEQEVKRLEAGYAVRVEQ
ncbi:MULTISPECIES: peptidyl-prolyl cis-trans isomerase [unclassified Sphingobium]|uniref:peptidylprolyl isomerase n=1 Tax=unclassified Sphingobium TaxID=2611147 RepID=UPI0012EE50A8|nr:MULTISPECIES: peptidylprolyl isomerase [unclassified Sphingobium]WIW88930.1 peptidylprolyl isomerase [Sphingobium sp. V4]